MPGMTQKAFKKIIWDFYKKNKRDLPWRKTRDPYKILVSEIMLQQTQVIRVIPKYRAWLKKFPTLGKLAATPLADVLVAWQGLGYNRRAIALHRLSQVINQLPKNPIELEKLPGIGPYTATAVCVFAHNQPHAMIETNIRRVFIYHFSIFHDREILNMVQKTMDVRNPRDWYYALMDYGSYLSTQVENPNRRSAHYVKQSKFEGSFRQIRGEVLRLLLSGKKIPKNPPYLKALHILQREGFVI